MPNKESGSDENLCTLDRTVCCASEDVQRIDKVRQNAENYLDEFIVETSFLFGFYINYAFSGS